MVTVGYYRAMPELVSWEAAFYVDLSPEIGHFITGRGDTEAEAKADFVAAYNTEMNTSHTTADFTWDRSPLVEAEIYPVGAGWECYANPGDRPPVVVLAPTEQEAKDAFILAWNTSLAASFEPAEFRFTPLPGQR